MRPIDLTGRKAGRLTAQWPAGRNVRGQVIWLSLCLCGKLHILCGTDLGHTRSCGCLKAEMFAARQISMAKKRRIHGHSLRRHRSPEYLSWENMIQRCTNPSNTKYKIYGGSGVKVCGRWRRFENFLADVGPRPLKTTLGRIGDQGNYSLTNARWMTQREQIQNRRKRAV